MFFWETLVGSKTILKNQKYASYVLAGIKNHTQQ